MDSGCIIAGCRNYGRGNPGLVVFPLPKDPILIKLWLEFAKRQDLIRDVSFDEFRICTEHFKASAFMCTSPRFRLKKGAIPTENPPPSNFTVQTIKTPAKKTTKSKVAKAKSAQASQPVILYVDNGSASHFTDPVNVKVNSTPQHVYIQDDHDYSKVGILHTLLQCNVDNAQTSSDIGGEASEIQEISNETLETTAEGMAIDEESGENITYIQASDELLKQLDANNIQLVDGQVLQIEEDPATGAQTFKIQQQPQVIEEVVKPVKVKTEAKPVDPQTRLIQLEEQVARQRKVIATLRSKLYREKNFTQKLVDASKTGSAIPERKQVQKKKVYSDNVKQAYMELYCLVPSHYRRLSKILGFPTKVTLKTWNPELPEFPKFRPRPSPNTTPGASNRPKNDLNKLHNDLGEYLDLYNKMSVDGTGKFQDMNSSLHVEDNIHEDLVY